jgi:hypothetical protein
MVQGQAYLDQDRRNQKVGFGCHHLQGPCLHLVVAHQAYVIEGFHIVLFRFHIVLFMILPVKHHHS